MGKVSARAKMMASTNQTKPGLSGVHDTINDH